MKEYARGAFEVLNWAMTLLLDVKELPDLQRVTNQIDQVINRLRTLAAKDFQDSIQAATGAPGSS